MDTSQSKTTAAFISVAFHIFIAILILILPAFTVNKDAVPANELIVITTGDAGGAGDNSFVSLTSAETSQTQESQINNDIHGDDPILSSGPVVKPQATPDKPKDRVPDQGSIYSSHSKGGGGGGGGNGDDIGPGSNKGLDPGKGPNDRTTSTRTGLGHRAQLTYPDFGNDFAEEGSLVFSITVDRQGNVKRVEKIPPSTVSNLEQINKARQLILTYAKFAAKPEAEEEQIGTYTVVFKKK